MTTHKHCFNTWLIANEADMRSQEDPSNELSRYLHNILTMEYGIKLLVTPTP